MDNEGGDCLAEFSASFHDAQTQRNDFCFDQKVNDSRVVNLDESADHTERRQSEVLKAAAFAHSVQKGKSVEVNIGLQKQIPRVFVTGYRLQQSQHITSLVRRFAI